MERLWEKFANDGLNDEGRFLVGQMAAIDAEQAQAWSARHDNRFDDVIRRKRAELLAETDAAAAIKELTEKPDNLTPYTLQDLAERLVDDGPGQGMRSSPRRPRSASWGSTSPTGPRPWPGPARSCSGPAATTPAGS